MEEKKNERMSSMCTRIEHNTVAETFLSLFIHPISQKYMHSNNSVVFFLFILYYTKAVIENDTLSTVFFSRSLCFTLLLILLIDKLNRFTYS
jgi:hypothetical protein